MPKSKTIKSRVRIVYLQLKLGYQFVTQAFEYWSFPEEMNIITITLFPKQTPMEKMGHLRPISLRNVVIKCITKMVATRLNAGLTQVDRG